MAEKSERVIIPQNITVVFDYEVSIKNEKVKELTIKKPKMKDVLAREQLVGTLLKTEVWAISSLTGATVSDIEELDNDQYQLLQDALGKLSGSVPMTT